MAKTLTPTPDSSALETRFIQSEGTNVYSGNELILKGALEAGVGLITGYPGSPVSELFDSAYAQRSLLKEQGVLAQMANNEALAVARLNGSRMAGVRAMAVMKSVGLHVAADGLALGNLAEPSNGGGGVVVVGDDPWIDSTQINNDSRYLSQHLHMPVLEPSTFQELKDWVGQAFDLSSAADLYITYLVTTHQADGGGTVWLHPNRKPAVSRAEPMTLDSDHFNLETTVLLPPRTWNREATLPHRFEKLLAEVRRRGLNRITSLADSRQSFGFVASGLAYCYLEHALNEMGLTNQFPILKLGCTYPVDPEILLRFASGVDALYVVEEKRGFLEAQILTRLQQAHQEGKLAQVPPVWGKKFPGGAEGFPETRGLNPTIVQEKLSGLVPGTVRGEPGTRMLEESLPTRTPTFCPGCPHRDSSSLFLEIKKDFRDPAYMQRVHGRGVTDLIFHGETGCFSMLMFEPNKPLMHNYSGMGLGGGTGAGADPFITNKQVVFLGDSTFFHSGMVAISDSMKSGQDVTYVILDNQTTAMTGHQPTPGTALNLMGEKTYAQSIDRIVEGITAAGAIPVRRVNPEERESYRALLEETILKDGVKVLIADKECGLTHHREVKHQQGLELAAQGYLSEERVVNITPEVCEFCLECTKTTGCPGFAIEQTHYGPKVATDLSHCVADGACARVKVCPAFEEITIYRKSAKALPILPALDELPPAPVREVAARWHLYTAAVGGMGVALLSEVLVRAGHQEGFRVLFLDKKGLAVRNGAVYGQIIFSREGGTLSPVIPEGRADLLLGIDLLEAARVSQASRTAAIVNTALNPTVRMLLGQENANVSMWEALLKQSLKAGAYWGEDVSAISEYYFGSKVYANVLLLGVASQRGELPVSAEAIEASLQASLSSADFDMNRRVFRAGRALVVRPEAFKLPQRRYSVESLVAEKKDYLQKDRGASVADGYLALVDQARRSLPTDDSLQFALALRLYDLIQYEDVDLATAYLSLVKDVAKKDHSEQGWQATAAVIENAFKVIAIKDEIYVAYLLTRREKHARDLTRYRVNEAAGDRLIYRHINRPEFTVGRTSWRWDMHSKDWQLHLLKRMKFLRRWLPKWHREEKEFRDWYLGLLRRFDPVHYATWMDLLKLPENVRGFREVRRPAMQAAKLHAKKLMDSLKPSTLERTACLP